MSETVTVRPGEELDVDRLQAFLGRTLSVGDIGIEQFPGGSSNLTYLIRLGSESDEPGTQVAEYVLRRPPFGNTVKTAHDMRREFDVLAKLSSVYKPAPKPLVFCDDASVIGSEFYLMERRHGLIIRGRVPGTRGLAEQPQVQASSAPPWAADGAMKPTDLETSQNARRALCRAFIANLADLHSLDYKAAGLETLGRTEGYNRRQVEGWTKRYFAARTHAWDALESSIEWLNANIPPESGASLIHNDYKFDNIMLHPNDLRQITAVLDWEMVTIGDPLMDLGTTLGYWMTRDAPDELLRMPFNPLVLMANVERRELVEMYAESLGRAMPDMLFHYVFGTVKIAAIAQQIYSRYTKGLTRDPRFAGFSRFVEALGRIAANSIDRGTI